MLNKMTVFYSLIIFMMLLRDALLPSLGQWRLSIGPFHPKLEMELRNYFLGLLPYLLRQLSLGKLSARGVNPLHLDPI